MNRLSFLVRAVVLLALVLLAGSASAQTRAWLDRDSISANETVTLNIRTDGMARPDYTPLLGDFNISGRSSRTEMDNTGVHSLYAVALQPRRAGRIAISSLAVGSARTQPLFLQVEAASAPLPSRAGDDVFVGLPLQERIELLSLDRLAFQQDLGHRLQRPATRAENVRRPLMGPVDDACDLVVDLGCSG